jgi:hypothetical protein
MFERYSASEAGKEFYAEHRIEGSSHLGSHPTAKIYNGKRSLSPGGAGMSFPTKAAVEAKAAQNDYQFARENGLVEIYRAFPTIPRSQANDQMIDEVCSTFLGVERGEVAPTLAIFRSAVEADRSIIAGKGSGVFIEPVAKQAQKLLAEIEELLTNAMSPFDLAAELKKLSFWTVPQLQARKQQIRERQRLHKFSVDEIRKEVAASRPQPHRYHPYDLLPRDVTATELKRILASSSARQYVRRFGTLQLNDRLTQRG